MPLEIVQGTGNAKSASQQEEWDWRSWKVKEGKEEEEVQEELVVLWE